MLGQLAKCRGAECMADMLDGQSMIPKSGDRFSEKIMRKTRKA